MRTLSISLLLALAVSVPAAGQDTLLPIRCAGECAAGVVTIDSVRVWTNHERGHASTFVNYVFVNHADSAVDAAFFFPIPADAQVGWTTVYANNASVLAHSEHSGPDDSRRMLDQLSGDAAALCPDGGCALVHTPIDRIPPGGVRRLQIHYSQPLEVRDGAVRWVYPLTAGATPIGHLTLGMEITTEAGFQALDSPSHGIDLQWGSESVRCPPQMRCGYRGATSHRVRIVRVPDAASRARDFELVYTPSPIARARALVRPNS